MNRWIVVPFLCPLAACEISQSLQGALPDAGGLTFPSPDAGSSPGADAKGPLADGSPQADTNTTTGPHVDAGAPDTSTGPQVDSGAPDAVVANVDAGASCADVPGYPTVPGVYATITGSDLKGTYALAFGPLCGLAGASEPAGIAGNYMVFANDQGQPMQEFWLWTPGVAAPAVGTAYPMNAWFELLFPTVNPDTLPPNPNGSSPPYTYPPSASGPGSCTITFDEVSQTANCARARFSCTGLVGSTSQQTFDVTNGTVVCGAAPSTGP